MSTSTPADPLAPFAGGVTEQVVAAAAELCGSGVAVARSAALSSVSVQPPSARASAVGRARRRRRTASLVVGGAAVADEVLHVGGRGAATRRVAAGQRSRIVDECDLAAGDGEVRGAGGVGGRQRRAVRSAGGELDEVAAARRDRAAQRGRLPARTGGGCVLERPAVDGDRARASIEQLDVIVRVDGAAVAAGRVQLAHDEAARAAAACRRGAERQGESREQDEQVDALHGASDPGEVDGPLATARRVAPTVSFAELTRSRHCSR